MAKTGFGERIAELRRLAGLGPSELSGLAGLARGHARQIEQDSPGRIAVATLAALASVFDVTIDWLYLGRGPRPSDRRVRAAVLSARVAKAPKQGRG